MLFATVALASAFMAPLAHPSRIAVSMGGKGFGGGEATRDPAPTAYDPNDPKGKQQAIHKAESFAEYLAKRGAGGEAAAPAPAPPAPAAAAAPSAPPAASHGGKGFGGGEATRDPAPTVYDPNDPKGKQGAIHKAESFAEYLAKRG
jgi:rRNA maturation protein Nop10